MSLENTSNNYQNISVAPLQIKPLILKKIDEQIELAKKGLPNGVLFKTNSITDKEIIDKIAESSQAGVHTTLFVRGISCIVPGVEGYTDNVEVVSIVGRLLEHSRIYGFGPHDEMELYLASADLMTRNMDKRIEIAWPITEDALRQQILEYLDISLSDTTKLRKLQSNLEFTPLEYFAEVNKAGVIDSFDSQEYLIKKAKKDYEDSIEKREEENRKRSAVAQAQRLRDTETLRYAASVATPVQVEAILTKTAISEPSIKTATEPEQLITVEETEVTAKKESSLASNKESTVSEIEKPVTNTQEVQSKTAPSASAVEKAVVSAPEPVPTNQHVVAEVLPAQETPSQNAIQLVEKKEKKPGFFKRLKFLFTGHF